MRELKLREGTCPTPQDQEVVELGLKSVSSNVTSSGGQITLIKLTTFSKPVYFLYSYYLMCLFICPVLVSP